MRVRRPAHKSEQNAQCKQGEGAGVTGATYRALPTFAADSGDDTSCATGTNCMIMISTQRPIAVSMVAGRVCRCGVGVRFSLTSVIAGHSP